MKLITTFILGAIVIALFLWNWIATLIGYIVVMGLFVLWVINAPKGLFDVDL